jgi:hypothetical protein
LSAPFLTGFDAFGCDISATLDSICGYRNMSDGERIGVGAWKCAEILRVCQRCADGVK